VTALGQKQKSGSSFGISAKCQEQTVASYLARAQVACRQFRGGLTYLKSPSPRCITVFLATKSSWKEG
jgi:hypothetical protein